MVENCSIEKEMREKGLESSLNVLQNFDCNRLSRYLEFLREKNPEGGFFSKGDGEQILERHLLDSLFFVEEVREMKSVSRETSVVDVGTGPGLPGYLMACLKQDRPLLTLMDSSRRRLSLLEEYHRMMFREDRVDFAYIRSEESKKKYDVILVRALIPYPSVLEILLPLMHRETEVFLYQGKTRGWKKPLLENYLLNLGISLLEIREMNLEDFPGSRNIIHLKKTGRAGQSYPRSWKKIKEEISKWEKLSQ